MSFEVSVVIPTYNRAHLIPATLDSVLAQTHRAAEIIVVDDGSSDDTESVLRRRYPFIRYKRVSNAGAPNARNVGVQLSSNPWLAFLDSDDLWTPDKLARHAEFHVAVPELEYMFTNFRIVANDRWQDRTKFDDAPLHFFDDADPVAPGLRISRKSMYDKLLRFQPIFPSCFAITRALFDKVGGWEPSLGRNLSEDFEFTLRCSLTASIGIIEDPLVGIRKHGSNFSGDKLRLSLAQAAILKFVETHHDLPDSTRAEVKRQINVRTSDAVDLAFGVADFKLVRDLLSELPRSHRTAKQGLKGFIAGLPSPVAGVLARTLTR